MHPEMDPIHGSSSSSSSHRPFNPLATVPATHPPAVTHVHHRAGHRSSSDMSRGTGVPAGQASGAGDKLAKMRLTVKRVNENRSSWTVCSPVGQPLPTTDPSLSHVTCTSSASTSRPGQQQQHHHHHHQLLQPSVVSPPSPCSSSSDEDEDEESESDDDKSSDSESEGSDSSDWSDRSCSCSCSSSHSSRSSSPCRATASSSSSSTLVSKGGNSRMTNRESSCSSSSTPTTAAAVVAVEEIQRLRRYRIPVSRTESTPLVPAGATPSASQSCSPLRSSKGSVSQACSSNSQLVGERRAPASATTTATTTSVTKSCSSSNGNRVRSNSSISSSSSLPDVKPVISTSSPSPSPASAAARNAVTCNQAQQVQPLPHMLTPKPQQPQTQTQLLLQQQQHQPQQPQQQQSHIMDNKRCPQVMPRTPGPAPSPEERKWDGTSGQPSPASLAAAKSALPPEERQRLRSYRIPHLRTPRPERSTSRNECPDASPTPSLASPAPAPVPVATNEPAVVPVPVLPPAVSVPPVVAPIPKVVHIVKQVPPVVTFPAATVAAVKSVSTSTSSKLVPKLTVSQHASQQQPSSSSSSSGAAGGLNISSPKVPDTVRAQIKSPPVSRDKQPKRATTSTTTSASTMTTDVTSAISAATATPPLKSGAQVSPGVRRILNQVRPPVTTSASTMTEDAAMVAATTVTMNTMSPKFPGFHVPQEIFPKASPSLSPDVVHVAHSVVGRKSSPSSSSSSPSSSCSRSASATPKPAASIAAKLIHMPSSSSSSATVSQKAVVVVDVSRLIESVTSQVSELRLQSCRSSSAFPSAASLLPPHVVNDIFKHRDYLMTAKRDHKILTSKSSPQIPKHQVHGSGGSSSGGASSRGSPSHHRKQLTPPVPLITREVMSTDPVVSPLPSVNPVEVFVTEETSDFCTHENNKKNNSNANMRKRRINRTGWDRVKKKKNQSSSSTSSSPNLVPGKGSSCHKPSLPDSDTTGRSSRSSCGSREGQSCGGKEERVGESGERSGGTGGHDDDEEVRGRDRGAGRGGGEVVVQQQPAAAGNSRSSTAAVMSPDPLIPDPVPCTPEEQAARDRLSDDTSAATSPTAPSPLVVAADQGRGKRKRKIIKAKRSNNRKTTTASAAAIENGTERPVATATTADAAPVPAAAVPPAVKRKRKKKSEKVLPTPSPASAPSSCREEHDCDPGPSINITKPSTIVDKVRVKKVRRSSIFKPPVKKYLKSGLLSDDYKTDLPEAAGTEPRPDVQTDSASLPSSEASDPGEVTGEPEEVPAATTTQTTTARKPLLGPPVYCSDEIRTKFIDFQLPYDIYVYMQAKKETTASGSNNPSVKTYKKVRQNAFGDVKPASNIDPQACMCSYPKEEADRGCGSECINRLMYVECDPDICPSRERCSNQRMQKHDWSPGLERFLTKDRGWGVRTTEKIREGEFILEYIGEVVSHRLFRDRMSTMYKNDPHHYCLNLDSRTVIDGYRIANEGRFVNHSCEPNCEMQKWSCNGYYRVGLFSLRDIDPGEELSYDYNFDNYNSEHQQVCHCGSSKCRGVIGGRKKAAGNNSERRTSTDSVISGTAPVQPAKKKRRKSSIVKVTAIAASSDVVDPTAAPPLQSPVDDKKLIPLLPPPIPSSVDEVIEQVIKMENDGEVEDDKESQNMDQYPTGEGISDLLQPKIEPATSITEPCGMTTERNEVKISTTINHSPRKRLLNRLMGEVVAEANPSS